MWSWDAGKVWQVYPKVASDKLEAGYQIYKNDPTKSQISLTTVHSVNFKTMQQFRTADSARTRKVKREMPGDGTSPVPSSSISVVPIPQSRPTSSTFILEEIKGDLFSETRAALAHCVSQDIRMGKGIAVLFKKKFEGVDELKAQGPKIGETLTLTREGRKIYYMITKFKYSDKPSYENFERSLRHLKSCCARDMVSHLAMPRIGCGLDGLDWETVKRMIATIFKSSTMRLTIYSI